MATACDGLDHARAPRSARDANGCSDAQLAARNQPAHPAAPPPPARQQTETEKKLSTGHMRLEEIYFESGSDKLLPESDPALNELGDALQRNPDSRYEIQGHTDSHGPAEYNMKLSQMRAETVRTWLITHKNISGDRLVAKGYAGETRPETKERNQEELLRNRHVDMVLIHSAEFAAVTRPARASPSRGTRC